MEYQKYQEQYTDKNIEWFFDNCPEIIDRIKEKINVNFQPNKINTKEIKQIYTDYINTFFSNHILVYRWDTPDLESFHYSEQIRKKWSLVMNYLKFWSGIYLTNNKWMADNFAKQNNWKLYYCFINKDNIISFNNKEEYDNHIKQYYNIERVTTLNRDDYTKYLQSQNKILHIKNNGEWKEEFITNIDNLHILWSEKNLELFYTYFKNKESTKNNLINNLKQ